MRLFQRLILGSLFSLYICNNRCFAQLSDNAPKYAINFGLVQAALGGFNFSGEVKTGRLWLTYQHGVSISLNKAKNIGLVNLAMSKGEQDQSIDIFIPYSTGFGVGYFISDGLWLGSEFTRTQYEVSLHGGPKERYQTDSIGLVLGYRYVFDSNFFANGYLRYWPNISSSLSGNTVSVQGPSGSVEHNAHEFGFYPNISCGYQF